MTDPDPTPLELSIVIITYNSRRHVRDCLESIQQTAGDIQHEVIVVDNASQDGTPDILRNEFPDVRLIANPENPGSHAASTRESPNHRGAIFCC